MLEHVEQTTNAGRLALLDELLRATGHEHGLHEAPGLREIKKLTLRGTPTHLDNFLSLVEADIRQSPHRNVDGRVPFPFSLRDNRAGHVDELFDGFLISFGQLDFGCFGHNVASGKSAERMREL